MAEMQAGPADQASPAQDSESQGPQVMDLVSSLHDGLMQLMKLEAKSNAVSDDEKQSLAAVIQAFQQHVDGLSQSPDEQPPAQPGVSSPETGAAKVQPAL